MSETTRKMQTWTKYTTTTEELLEQVIGLRFANSDMVLKARLSVDLKTFSGIVDVWEGHRWCRVSSNFSTSAPRVKGMLTEMTECVIDFYAG